MRLHLAVELPADLVRLFATQMVALKQVHAVVRVTAGKVASISGDNELLNGVCAQVPRLVCYIEVGRVVLADLVIHAHHFDLAAVEGD